jgi:hypothetical protein
VSEVEVDIMNDYDEIILGDEISLNGFFSSDEDVVRILWSQVGNADVECNSCLNTSVVPINDGFYNFSVINSLGCRASDEIFIRVRKEREVFYPNIIKLDQEGPNSKMLISGRNSAAEGLTFKVFDRWGNKLHNISNFTLNSLDHAWDGTHDGNPVEEGVYVWKALIRYIDGFEKYYSGTITVLR